MSNVIYDVISGIKANWNESVINKPTFFEGVEQYNKNIRENMPMGGGNTVFVSNPKTNPVFLDPERTRKDVTYHMNVKITSSTGSKRDSMFDEAYRIVEATGITDYDNRIIKDYQHKNEYNYFTAEINFSIVKYNESVAR